MAMAPPSASSACPMCSCAPGQMSVRLPTMREGEGPMSRVNRPSRDHPHGTCVGVFAVLILAALPLLAASTFSAPTAQILQHVSYLPLIMGSPYYRIAFVSQRDGNAEIYVTSVDGSNLTNLSNNPARDVAPAWS